MKLKSASLVVLACAFTATACSQLDQTTYWKRVDNGSSASLTSPEAAAPLDKAVAACTRAVDDMDAQQADPHNFDGCMQGEGWERQSTVPPSSQELKADNSGQQDARPIPQAVMTDNEKQQTAAIAHDLRNEELVPRGGQVSLGVQGYQDRYNESTPGVNIHTNYLGAVAGYTRRDGDHNFWTVDGRAAHGLESYNSPSGEMDGVPEFEGELRLTLGKDYALENSWVSPYGGLGTRFFRDDGKGHFTNLGAFAYDRRIEQLYLPLGATWRNLLPGDRATMASTLEFDPMLIGSVNSRLSNGGGPNIVNTQGLFTGWGVRGEMMFGVPLENQTMELGPFFRYWNINDSTANLQSCNGNLCLGYEEPYNTRLQIGVTTRVSF